jgi:hypothetical protein
MALESLILDARGNPYQGALDAITGETITDARAATATLSVLNAESIMDLNGKANVMVDMRSAAGVLTLVFEGTVDGTNYFSLPGLELTTEIYSSGPALSGTFARIFTIDVAGFRRFRVRVSAYTSGNVTVALRACSADYMIVNRPIPSTSHVTVTAAANTAATITLPAAGAGLFHYITNINICRNATAALAGTATLVITSTNLPGSPAWSVGNAMIAGGTQIDLDYTPATPLKSSAANTATTIVMPAPGAAVLWRGNCTYYIGA